MIDWEDKPELNITPLVDVMLVLISILMVTLPAVVYEEKIQLPKGSKSAGQLSEDEAIVVRVDRQRNVYLGDKRYDLAEFPDSFLGFTNGMSKERSVLLRADKQLIYDDVMAVMKGIKACGFSKISLLTDG